MIVSTSKYILIQCVILRHIYNDMKYYQASQAVGLKELKAELRVVVFIFTLRKKHSVISGDNIWVQVDKPLYYIRFVVTVLKVDSHLRFTRKGKHPEGRVKSAKNRDLIIKCKTMQYDF